MTLPTPPTDTLNDYEHEVQSFRFGLPTGPVQAPTQVRIESWSGYGNPDQNPGDANPPAADGTRFGSDWLGPRTFAWTAHLVAPTAEEVMALHDAMADAWTFAGRTDPSAVTTYRSKMPGRPTMLAYGRPRSFHPIFDALAIGQIDVDCEFYCGDPLLYADDDQPLTLGLGGVSGSGLTVPVDVPLVLSTPSAGGNDQIFTNAGNTPTFPIITINGPVNGPKITNLDTADYIDLPSLVLTTGQHVIIDTRPIASTILRGGGANAYGYLAAGSTLFSLPPGSSRLRFSATAYSSTATATVSARSAWER